LVALDLQVVAKTEGQVGIVFDDENASHVDCGMPVAECGLGSSTTNRAPPPDAVSIQQLPPCIPVSSRTIARPSPVPAIADSRSRGSRQKRSQIRSRSAGSMPGPWSETASRT